MATTPAPKKPAAAPAPVAPTARTGPNVDLFIATARILLAVHIGHTDNNSWHLARGNRSDWSISFLEAVPTAAAGKTFYDGPTRPEDEDTETGYAKIDYSMYTKAQVRAWYAAMPRRTAHLSHEEGRALIGLSEMSPLCWWSPTRNDLRTIIAGKDPILTAIRLATDQPVESDGSMNAKTRRAITAAIAKITKAIKDGKNPRGQVITMADEYGTPDVMAVIKAIDLTAEPDAKRRLSAIAELLAKI